MSAATAAAATEATEAAAAMAATATGAAETAMAAAAMATEVAGRGGPPSSAEDRPERDRGPAGADKVCAVDDPDPISCHSIYIYYK